MSRRASDMSLKQGKAGCGKTILCFKAIESVRIHSQLASNVGHAIFYFSFSDSYKQTYRNLIVSLVAQLCNKEPGLSMLRQAYEKPERSQPGLDESQRILYSSAASYDKIFLHLDALDECPESEGMQQTVLDGVQQLLARAPNVCVLATSRDVPNIHSHMEELGATKLSIAAQTINADIGKYISSQLSRDRKLSRLDLPTQTLIKDTLSNKANGMFRWVFCQLQELSKSKSTRPKSVKAALLALPETLDETYERMSISISEDDRPYALTFLRWLAYATSPLSLGQLTEASVIDPTDDPAAEGIVDIDNKGGWGDALEILAGLVITEGADEQEEMANGLARLDVSDDGKQETGAVKLDGRAGEHTRVRLAPFSVKEYLESTRILSGNAKESFFDPTKEHGFLTQSCLVYLTYYSNCSWKTSTTKDLGKFPLLEYAAESWGHHASLQKCDSTTRESTLLYSNAVKRDWLLVHDPDDLYYGPFSRRRLEDEGDGLYYASQLGLEAVVRMLMEAGADVNAQGGEYGNALQAASYQGHKVVVRMLMEAGADVNAQAGEHGNALQAASSRGHKMVVRTLMEAGADVNAEGKNPPTPVYVMSTLANRRNADRANGC